MKKINVAIAEDHVMFSDGIAMLLDSLAKIKVTQKAKNGKILLQQIEESSIKPDVVLMDVFMPEMDGYETAIEVLKLLPDCKILFMSAYDNPHFIERAMQCKGSGYILKSSNFDTFFNAIIEVYYKGFYFNEYFNFSKLLKLPSVGSQLTSKEYQKDWVLLNERELEIIRLLFDEKTDSQIAQILNLKLSTAQTYRKNIMRKVNAKKTVGIIVYAIKQNLV